LGIAQADGQASLWVSVNQKDFLPRLAQVVVLPTPPFWLAMAIICVFMISPHFFLSLDMKKVPALPFLRKIKQALLLAQYLL